jgi:transcription initiation factor IIE alpha subunit
MCHLERKKNRFAGVTISRQEAIDGGKTYYKGATCPTCGGEVRYTSNSNCAICTRPPTVKRPVSGLVKIDRLKDELDDSVKEVWED